MPWASPVLWVLGCFALLLCLWALCTACHRYVHLQPGIGVGLGFREARHWLYASAPYWALDQRLMAQCPISASLA